MMGTIRVGIGGWTFAPWRGVFFPQGLPQSKELAYSARHLTTLEINGTYYRNAAPASFAKWGKEAPDGFVFTVKASRFCTNRKILSDAGDSVAKFLASGLSELGDKLGPILWQFMPTKKFDPDDFEGFLKLLQPTHEGQRLRHAIEVRHDSFMTPAFVTLARKYAVAIVFADNANYPAIPDLTGDFAYARLQDAKEHVETGYDPAQLARWAGLARAWAAGDAPEGLSYLEKPTPTAQGAAIQRDVFVLMINGAKVRAPAAAMALIEKLAS